MIRVCRIKYWLEKNEEWRINKLLDKDEISWYHVTKLDQKMKNWIKRNVKCREPTKYEGIILWKENEGDKKVGKGTVSKIYSLFC